MCWFKFNSGAALHGIKEYFFVLVYCLGKYTALECFIKSNYCNLQAFWNSVVFHNKHEYFEECYELSRCLSKHTILE